MDTRAYAESLIDELDGLSAGLATNEQAREVLRVVLRLHGEAMKATELFDGVFERTAKASAVALVNQRREYAQKVLATLQAAGPVDPNVRKQVQLAVKQSAEAFKLVDSLGREKTSLLQDLLDAFKRLMEEAAKAAKPFTVSIAVIAVAVVVLLIALR